MKSGEGKQGIVSTDCNIVRSARIVDKYSAIKSETNHWVGHSHNRHSCGANDSGGHGLHKLRSVGESKRDRADGFWIPLNGSILPKTTIVDAIVVSAFRIGDGVSAVDARESNGLSSVRVN